MRPQYPQRSLMVLMRGHGSLTTHSDSKLETAHR